MCVFIIHVCLLNTDGVSVRIYGDAKNAKTQGTAPTSICTAMQCNVVH